MQPVIIENPILNSPFREPDRHFKFDDTGITNETVSSRRPSAYFIPIPKPRKSNQKQLILQTEWTESQREETKLVNDIRVRVGQWRTGGYVGVTPLTARLLQYWSDPERERKLFFCQIEALETLIYLTEVAHKYGDGWIQNRLQEENDQFNGGLPRIGVKMATGSGKTVVMAMIIAWQTLNKLENVQDARFSDTFLIVTPGLTIRDRLRVLLPNDPDNYYQQRDLLPPELKGRLHQARIIITNYHAFLRREKWDASKTAKQILGNDQSGAFTETPDQMVRRVCRELGGKKNLIVLNDEAHHCYFGARYEVTEFDFHEKDSETPILIELRLDPPLVERDVYQKEYKIHGFRFRAWRKVKGDKKGDLDTEHVCLDENGKTILKPRRIYRKAKGEEEDVDNTPWPVKATDQAWKVGKCFYLNPFGLDRFFDRKTGYTPLGRLFDIYRDDFPLDSNTYKIKEGEEVPARVALERISKRLSAVLRTGKLAEIETSLSGHVAALLGNTEPGGFRLDLTLPSHQEIFERWLNMMISEGAQREALPATRVGTGYQALLRLAVIQSLLDLSDKDYTLILLMEEPETFLHVHLQRYLGRTLRALAEKGTQIVITTHSEMLADLDHPHEIIRTVKMKGKSLSHQVSDKSKFNFASAKRKIVRLGNEELFFAAHVLLVEGHDEQAVLAIVLRALGVDPDVAGISVIACDGKASIPEYIRLCSELRIDFYAIHDEDKPADPVNKKIAKAVEASGKRAPSLHAFAPCMEAVMGMAVHCGIDALVGKVEGKDSTWLKANLLQLIVPVEEFISSRNLAKPQPAARDVTPAEAAEVPDPGSDIE